MTQTLDDRIVVFFNRCDLADPETARNAALSFCELPVPDLIVATEKMRQFAARYRGEAFNQRNAC